MAASLSVQICDDHALIRSGIRSLLEAEPDLEVVAESGSADEAVAQLRTSAPDVLLLDLAMPGRTGIEAMPEITAVAPRTKVLFVTTEDDPAYVRQAFAAGATGYLLKDAAGEELVQAIHDVANGRRYVHPLLGARLATSQDLGDGTRQSDPLSDRERDVLRLLALGHTNHEMAVKLSISIRTVESHRARIMHKLGLHTRAEIVRYAIAHRLLEGAREGAL